jgi:hypothetical protein
MMNRDLVGGVYVALKGRVPVKIIGGCSKGDNIIPAGAGCGQTDNGNGNAVFAVALEDCANTDETLVECVIL